ncbi:hypothetical protein LTR04_004011 [Oleoguttula sp. CCFEE 6159]|nr:hypothetical protein LTR04_004011 [Oleoguttula sp. CCFEE 6159]
MRLEDFHMLKVFLSASASSARPSLVIAALETKGFARCEPRSASPLGWFGDYDGNIVGGLMVGFGMALTGACPGTVLVQLTTGVRSGWFAMIGAVLGGLSYPRVSSYLRRPCPPPAAGAKPKLTVHSKLGIDTNTAVLIYEATCLIVILSAMVLGPRGVAMPLHPLSGGLLIGAAQAASLLLTGKPVGVSTAYEEIGQSFWLLWNFVFRRTPAEKTSRPSARAIVFGGGVVAGAWALVHSLPNTVLPAVASPHISGFQGILGGFVMVFGARLAGGCTSGHGISGMAMLSLSSIVTVASMFAGGIGLTMIL